MTSILIALRTQFGEARVMNGWQSFRVLPRAQFQHRKVTQTRDCLQSLSRTNTGWALTPTLGKERQLHDLATQLEIATACAATSAETADPWIHLAIPNVPYRICGLNDNLALAEHTVSEGELTG